MEKILVTGGDGFLGRYIVNELFKDPNNDITILTINEQNTKSQAKLIISDITKKDELINEIKNFDTVYHVAGNIRTSETDTQELHFAINFKGTHNLLEACQINNIHRFIYISTSEVYGDIDKEQIKENEKKDPSNDYAKSKLLAEKCCRTYAQKHNFTITTVRPSYIYGFGQYKKRLFPKLIESALKSKKTKLKPLPGVSDFVYVKDVATGIVLLGKHEQRRNYEDYNISSGKITTNKEVFDVVKALTGCDYDNSNTFNKEEFKKFSLSIEKAKTIGYNPRFDLKKGLTDYIELYNSDKVK